MATQTFNTRIQSKFDTLSKWQAIEDTFKPLKGEICVVMVPASSGEVQQEPAFLIKVGDGINYFKDLEYVSGKAADVYDWAKKSTPDTYAITKTDGQNIWTLYKTPGGGGTPVACGQIDVSSLDTDTTYQFDTSTTDGTLKLLAYNGSTHVAAKDTSIDLTSFLYLKSDIDTMISELDDDIAEVAEALTTHEAKIAGATLGHIKTSTTDGDVAVNGTTGVASVNGWSTVKSDISTLQSDLDSAEEAIVTLGNTKQDNIVWQNDNYDATTNKAITKSDLDAAVEDIAGAMHYVGDRTAVPTTATYVDGTETKTYKKGDVIIIKNSTITSENNKEYLCTEVDVEGDTSTWREFGREGLIKNADVASDAAIEQSKISGLISDLNDKADLEDFEAHVETVGGSSLGHVKTSTADDKISIDNTGVMSINKPNGYDWVNVTADTSAGTLTIEEQNGGSGTVYTKTQTDSAIEGAIEDAIDALDGTATATAESDGKVSVLTSVVETNGVISKGAEVQLAKVAKSGDINDLLQASGDYVIFNCGTAETLI